MICEYIVNVDTSRIPDSYAVHRAFQAPLALSPARSSWFETWQQLELSKEAWYRTSFSPYADIIVWVYSLEELVQPWSCTFLWWQGSGCERLGIENGYVLVSRFRGGK